MGIPGLVPAIVFVGGCGLIVLEICFIKLVHHGRTPRRERRRRPTGHARQRVG